jgi:tetratricopeptide (TPR) repeat protein
MQPLQALGDKQGLAPLFNRLNDELLPTVQKIAEDAGRQMSFAHFSVGLILRILHRWGEAENTFRKVNELQPGVINTLRELVWCLGEQGKDQEALAFARESTKVDLIDAGAWGNLAMCLLRCGERAEARKAIDYALDLDPQDPINLSIRDNFESYLRSS